jgi:hypothetical protein
MKIYHQAGHNTNWNIESITKDQVGDGIIFSPVHYPRKTIESTNQSIKERSLFDPQFYVPDSQKKKFTTYPFFPETLMEGFSTIDYASIAHESAKQCIDFQTTNGFEGIIIPARFHNDLLTDYIEKQKAFTIEPFLEVINMRKLSKPIFLTLPITSPMALDVEYRTQLLNWVTSYPEISGIYLLVSHNETTKQLMNFEKLYAHFSFVQELKETGLEVLCGYAGTEGLLFSVISVDRITVGAYENTRGFSIDKFLDDDQTRRGPAPRMYFPKLLNWVRYDTAIEIKDDHPEIWSEIYTQNEYSEKVLMAGRRPHFSQPDLYKAHFALKYQQYKMLDAIPETAQRAAILKTWISEAMSLYQKIDNAGVMFFDINCKSDHLPIWNRLLNKLPV